MARKTYEMYCAVARALELLGERWTLLVVRELLTGPKRYADLQGGLPGIATNVLTDRIRSLLDAGVITQRSLPPPAASVVYELTDRGRELKPVLLALGTWGRPMLGPPRDGEQFRVAWLLIALDGAYDPAAVPEAVVISLRIGTEELTITADGASHAVTAGQAGRPDVVIEADPEVFLDWTAGALTDEDAMAAGLTASPPGALDLIRRMYPGGPS